MTDEVFFDGTDVVSVFLGGEFEADQDSFLKLADTLTSDTEEVADLLKGFFAVMKPKTTGDNLPLSLSLNTSQDTLNSASSVYGRIFGIIHTGLLSS
jgi:hypothetical protein